ncbi:hypothetical protein CLOM_g17440 [Closterium sp. NIES-68]|nr:hypothetical protein CLOM_g17440 [Closterium sp. NIES-68]GJP57890.1 hypothetical protein CLOP_g17932 [Closterium sp. NIES-67]GJP69716.1 hypothetical protein CLOP_g716 [Closterium sp. NIES-67]
MAFASALIAKSATTSAATVSWPSISAINDLVPRVSSSLCRASTFAARPSGFRQNLSLGSGFSGDRLRIADAGSVANGVVPRVGRPSQRRGLLFSATWLENKAVVEAPSVPLPLAFDLWLDRELIPSWMPWIASVKVVEDKPELSTWTLRYKAFGQNLEFSWLARNLQPIHHQKIHWRSLDGLPNSGAVRFFPKGPNGCKLEMTISYEVPGILVPVANSLSPLVESIIQADLERFVEFANKRIQEKA